MTHAELCRHVAKKCSIPESQVRTIVETMAVEIVALMTDGDEAKVKGLGTFYSKNYHVPKIDLEFGGKTHPGERRRLRFRPFDSTNQAVTDGWKGKHPPARR